ncbi:MAG: sugar kinase [bacterium]|nr:sugar kinase [bacterium]
MVDVVTLGETMLRLSPVSVSTLEESQQLQVNVGGAESNVAVGLSRMGKPAGWITKLVDNSIGRLIARRIHWHGVDTSRVVWSESGRNALYYLEPGLEPRTTSIIYDRTDSAFTTLRFEEIDWEYFNQARLVHLSGITPALSGGINRLTHQIIDHAIKHEKLISFDVNYRTKLWAPATAKKILTPIVEKVNLLICSLNDAATVFGYSSLDAEEVARGLLKQFRNRIVVLTLADKGALAFDGRNFWYQEAFQASKVDRIGRGDSFCAGFLYGYLTDDVQAGLKYGNAMAALNQTFKGDFFWGGKQEVDRLIAGSSKKLDR